jgi:hypothetical protein
VTTLTVAGLIAVALFALLLLTRPRKVMAGEMEAPMDLERGRAKSEAAMTAPLSEADATAAAPLVAFVEEIGTDELPIVIPVRRRKGYRKPVRWQIVAARRRVLYGFGADPLAAAIPGRHRVEEPVLFDDQTLRWFSLALPFPELPAEPVALPPLDFTGEFRRSDLIKMLEGADAR